MFFKNEAAVFGIDGDGPLPTNLCNGADEEENTIEVPHVDVPLTEEQFSQLQSQISPHGPGSNYGIEIYVRVLQFLSQTLYTSNMLGNINLICIITLEKYELLIQTNNYFSKS